MSKHKIPQALQKDGFGFVKLKPRSKIPFEHDWQNKPYSHFDIQPWIDQGGNYGVQGGYNKLIIIDSDSPEIDEIVKKHFPKTLTVRTPKQGDHYYYFCEGIDKKIVLNKNTANKKKDHLGEIITKGFQVVGAGSIHPDTGTEYELINDVEIATISREQIFSELMEYIPLDWPQKDKNADDNMSVVEILNKNGIQTKRIGIQLACSHPVHGSTNNNNVVVHPEKNVWRCFRCNTGGGALSLIAVLEGIIECREAVPGALRGDIFMQVLRIAKEKYGFDVKVSSPGNAEPILSEDKLVELERKIKAIPQETHKTKLPALLDPVLKEIAGINQAQTDAILKYTIKEHFNFTNDDLKSYETVLKGFRKEPKETESKRLSSTPDSKSKIILEEIEPWEEPVNGNEMLDTLYSVIQKYVILIPAAIIAIALWIVETYCYDLFNILPMLGLTSPEKRCGKTTLMQVLAGLVNKALAASNIRPAAVYRTVEKHKPCLLVDEADTFLKDNPELRGIINSGHNRKNAIVIRCHPITFEPEQFSTWCPKAISLIGKLPDTTTDRTIAIKMKRKLTSEKVKRMTSAFDEEYGDLRRMIKRWGNDNAEALKNLTLVTPETGNDRASDNWLPLLSIAELAGGEWPDRAREAMVAIESVSNEETMKQILLRDIKDIFHGRDKITSAELVEKLISIEDHPWADLKRGKPITQNGLAHLLKPFEIFSKTIRIGESTSKGYTLEQFIDAFSRYLPPSAFQSVTTSQTAPVKGLREIQSVTQTENVSLAKQRKPASINDCVSVTVQKEGEGQKALLKEVIL